MDSGVISASGLEIARCPDSDFPSAYRHGWHVRHVQDLRAGKHDAQDVTTDCNEASHCLARPRSRRTDGVSVAKFIG